MKTKVYRRIAWIIFAINRLKGGNRDDEQQWIDNHKKALNAIIENHMPHGSGFDNGTGIDLDKSTPERLVFKTAFHHMNDQGYYTEWSHHPVVVTPSLVHEIKLSVGGRDVRQIKDHIAQCFHAALNELTEL